MWSVFQGRIASLCDLLTLTLDESCLFTCLLVQRGVFFAWKLSKQFNYALHLLCLSLIELDTKGKQRC